MSDGTKQGNVVPLTTEYQNMLKSEFENKTGVTIGYIIIHRYTEETIDIESSITINSGDNPRIDLKIPFDDNIYAGGYLENKNFVLYGAENDYILQIKNVNGEVSNTYPNASIMLQNYIIPKMREKGYDVESSEIDTTSYSVGNIIPNWDSYINII